MEKIKEVENPCGWRGILNFYFARSMLSVENFFSSRFRSLFDANFRLLFINELY